MLQTEVTAKFSMPAHSPLTPTLSPEYGGEGAGDPLSRLRERVGVRVVARVNVIANHYTT
jgi:hypothetical protein